MNYFKLIYTAEYCGIEGFYIYKTEASLEEVLEDFSEFATDDARDYLDFEELQEIEQSVSQIAYTEVEEITEEEFYRLKDDECWELWTK